MTPIDASLDIAFPRVYECERLLELPGFGLLPHYYYPGATKNGGRDGVTVRVRPENHESWLGTFAFGNMAPKSLSGLFTTPNPERLCVVARGEGYLVSTSAPTVWERVTVTPILDVRTILARSIIVFANFTELTAYGPSGVKWVTKRLSWDGLKITEVSNDVIKGEFFDIRSNSTASFIVDLETGNHDGGMTGW